VYVALKHLTRAQAALLGVLLAVSAPAQAETAYIAQVNSAPLKVGQLTSSPAPQPVPVTQYGPSSTAYVPTPETARPGRNGNFAQTLEIGNFNNVFQSQSGGKNFSNVSVLGGKDNNIGVWQGGADLSKLNLINAQGSAIAVIQPRGASPLNMLVVQHTGAPPLDMLVVDPAGAPPQIFQPAGSPPISMVKLPNGVLLIKR
jgi:hypothetical protein